MTNTREFGNGQDSLTCTPLALVNALGKLLEVTQEQEFTSWLSGTLPAVVPGGPFFCGIGAMNDGMIRPKKLIQIGFPNDYLSQYQDKDGVAFTPFVRKALTAAGLVTSADLAHHLATPGDFQQFGDDSDVVAMAHADLHSGMISFFGQQGPAKRGNLEHGRTLSIVMPVLHSTLLKIAREQEQSMVELKEAPLFSSREAEVAHWMMMGKSNWSIATILEIGESTVKAHIRSIFSKLDVNGRTQAAAKLAELAQFSKTTTQ